MYDDADDGGIFEDYGLNRKSRSSSRSLRQLFAMGVNLRMQVNSSELTNRTSTPDMEVDHSMDRRVYPEP